MNIQRITISIPNYLYQGLIKRVQPRKMSKFVAEILEEKIFNGETSKNPVEDFFNLGRTLPKKGREEILAAIKKGRI